MRHISGAHVQSHRPIDPHSERNERNCSPNEKADSADSLALSSPPALSLTDAVISDLQTAFKNIVDTFQQSLKDILANVHAKPKPGSAPTYCHGVCQKPAEGTVQTPAETTSPSVKLTFSERQKQILQTDEGGKVTEAELRRGVVSYALYFKDASLGEQFDSSYREAISDGRNPKESLEKSLVDLIESGKFPREDANWLYSLSFCAANFDEVLPNRIDSTVSIDRDAAIQFAEATLAGIQSGAVKVERLSL